jgi:hypothetical protein
MHNCLCVARCELIGLLILSIFAPVYYLWDWFLIVICNWWFSFNWRQKLSSLSLILIRFKRLFLRYSLCYEVLLYIYTRRVKGYCRWNGRSVVYLLFFCRWDFLPLIDRSQINPIHWQNRPRFLLNWHNNRHSRFLFKKLRQFFWLGLRFRFDRCCISCKWDSWFLLGWLNYSYLFSFITWFIYGYCLIWRLCDWLTNYWDWLFTSLLWWSALYDWFGCCILHFEVVNSNWLWLGYSIFSQLSELIFVKDVCELRLRNFLFRLFLILWFYVLNGHRRWIDELLYRFLVFFLLWFQRYCVRHVSITSICLFFN